ncbi:MAG: hypothetical protein AAGE94_02240, partial [Acidobacteriota bacterium]
MPRNSSLRSTPGWGRRAQKAPEVDTISAMSILFHIPALAILGLAVLIPRRRPGVAPWLVGGLALAGIGSIAALAASGGSLFAAMRFGCWLLFAYLPIHALAAAISLSGRAPRPAKCWALGGTLALAVGAWAFWVEPRWLEISRHTIHSPKIDRPIRVAVLADLQTDRVGWYERHALAALMETEPDLILLPGDYLQIGDSAAREREAEKLREALRAVDFDALLGVYAVRGDVEVDGWESIFTGTGIQTFEKTTRIEQPEIVLTALSPRDARFHRAWPRRTERFHIAFGHAPDFVSDAVRAQLEKGYAIGPQAEKAGPLARKFAAAVGH